MWVSAKNDELAEYSKKTMSLRSIITIIVLLLDRRVRRLGCYMFLRC